AEQHEAHNVLEDGRRPHTFGRPGLTSDADDGTLHPRGSFAKVIRLSQPPRREPMLCAQLPSARSAVGAGRVQRHGRANKSLQCLLVNLLALMKVDGTPGVAIEAGVEEA